MTHSHKMPNVTGADIRRFRENNSMTQEAFAGLIGVSQRTVINYENGGAIPSPKMHSILNLMQDYERKKSYSPRFFPLETIDLPLVSVPARAGFAELGGIDVNTFEKYAVIKREGEDYSNNVVIEIDGDSMEPNYTTGMLVRAVSVPQSRWPYMPSGVYGIAVGDSFMIKRIKGNDYAKGYLVLHSDNETTGGSIEVKSEEIRSVWKVLRIVDGPAR